MTKVISKVVLWLFVLGIAFLLAFTVGAMGGGYLASNWYVPRHIHEAPHDGQWGLTVMGWEAVGGFMAGLIADTLILVYIWKRYPQLRELIQHRPSVIQTLLSTDG